MAINLSDVISEINTRFDNIDSNTSVLEQYRINAARDRLNAGGTSVLTYRSTGHLPPITDSAYVGSIAYVASDNVFGDSSGAFYFGTARDSGWVQLTLTQDSDEAAIEAPAGGGSYAPFPSPTDPHYIRYNRTGDLEGYLFGGNPANQTHDKVSFASDGNSVSTGIGPSAPPGGQGASASSELYGFRMTGTPSTDVYYFPYANMDAYFATGIGSPNSFQSGGQGNNSDVAIYGFGGYPYLNNIYKYPVASIPGGTISDIGDLTVGRGYNQGQSAASDTYGYYSGGNSGPSATKSNVIDKWPFAADANATDVGNLTVARNGNGGTGSDTHGYSAGGAKAPPTPAYTNIIDKWPFASDGNASDVGDLTTSGEYASGFSSTTHGYRGAQLTPASNTIDKWSFTSDGNATDVGDYSVATGAVGATQS